MATGGTMKIIIVVEPGETISAYPAEEDGSSSFEEVVDLEPGQYEVTDTLLGSGTDEAGNEALTVYHTVNVNGQTLAIPIADFEG